VRRGDCGGRIEIECGHRFIRLAGTRHHVRLGLSGAVCYGTAPNLRETGRILRSPVFFRAVAVAAQLLVALTLGPRAYAHAVIIDSTPTVDAIVAPGTVDIKLHYNSRIDHQRSRVTLFGPDGVGRRIDILPGSPPDIIVGRAADLSAGQYRLRWQVLAVDGHLTRGDIPFSVKAP